MLSTKQPSRTVGLLIVLFACIALAAFCGRITGSLDCWFEYLDHGQCEQSVLREREPLVCALSFLPFGAILGIVVWGIFFKQRGTQIMPEPTGKPLNSVTLAISIAYLAIEAWNYRQYIKPPYPQQSISSSNIKEVMLWGRFGFHSIDEGQGLAYHPSGSLLAIGYETGVEIWQVPEPKKLTTILLEEGNSRALAFSPDGNWLLTGSESGTIELWETHNWKRQTVLAANLFTPHAIAFSPIGDIAATAHSDGNIYLWHVPEGALLLKWEAHGLKTYSLAFISETRLASVGADGYLKVWSLPAGELEYEIEGVGPTASDLSLNDDKSLMAVGVGEDLVKIFHVEQEGLSEIDLGKRYWGSTGGAIVINPGGDVIAAGGHDSPTIFFESVLHEDNMKLLHAIRGFPVANELVFSPDGRYLVTKPTWGFVRIWAVWEP